MDLKNIIVEWVALLRVSHVFQVEMAEACPFWPMIRVRSGWISREEAGLKAHDEVKRASSRINANASRVQYTPSCTTMCTERSRDPTTTGDDLVIRNNADAFSDNSSRINARQGSLPGIQLSFPSMPFAIALQNHSEGHSWGDQ